MPGEGRSLRSGKDTSSSTNGEKARSNSQSSSSKDKLVPTRAASSKSKASGHTRKGSKKEPSSDKPLPNGQPIENHVNGVEDVEMADDGPEKAKFGNSRDGEDEMTVVVPPPKSSKLAGESGKDVEGDVAMESGEKEVPEAEKAEQLDPKVKAASGQLDPHACYDIQLTYLSSC